MSRSRNLAEIERGSRARSKRALGATQKNSNAVIVTRAVARAFIQFGLAGPSNGQSVLPVFLLYRYLLVNSAGQHYGVIYDVTQVDFR